MGFAPILLALPALIQSSRSVSTIGFFNFCTVRHVRLDTEVEIDCVFFAHSCLMFAVELNVFADLTFEEFRDTYLTAPQVVSL